MKKWETLNEFRIHPPAGGTEFRINDLLKILLENRGIKTKKEREEFLNPKLESVTAENVGIDKKQLKKAIDRIQKAILKKEQIVVFGDYDVDGICSSAILWETLNSLGAKVLPYIPHRIEEGYGLSIKGIENLRVQPSNEAKQHYIRVEPSFNSFKAKLITKRVQPSKPSKASEVKEVKLIITVDNGIVANEAVKFAKKQGIDVIITDHHIPSKRLPKSLAILHTTKLCGAGVAWLLSQEIRNSKFEIRNKSKIQNSKFQNEDHLELVALATVADMVPLFSANRTLLKFGLELLKKTKRIGLLALFDEAGIDKEQIGVYEIGHIIAPRLNATGRLQYAMDSLRLLCTKDRSRAKMLAEKLGRINRERQGLTEEITDHARLRIRSQASPRGSRKLLFISHESYQQGVIGLVAGKLVDEFYRPAIVVSKGKKYSKASARSVSGFNIIEFIRSASELLVDAGGHPMAAGFTVETEKLSLLQNKLEDLAQNLLDGEKLTRTVKIDCELSFANINERLYEEIQKLSPFGVGNPEPTFLGRNVTIEDLRLVGRDGQHLKLTISHQPLAVSFEAIAFGMGERASEFHIGDTVDVVYTIDEDRWNGNKRLQVKVKDMKTP